MTKNFRYVLAKATTPYVMWAAQDDLWDETFLEETLRMLSNAPDAMGSTTAIDFIDVGGNLVKRFEFSRDLMDRDPLVRAMSVQHGGFNAMYSLFRREMLPKRIVLEDISGQDMALVFGLALHGRFVVSKRALSIRRYIGYDDTLGPDGRLVWEKTLGPARHIYSRRPHAMCRYMVSYSRAAPIGSLQRQRLYAHVFRAWWWPRMLDLHLHDSRWRMRNAMDEHQYPLAFWLLVRHAALAPRASFRAAARWLSGLVLRHVASEHRRYAVSDRLRCVCDRRK